MCAQKMRTSRVQRVIIEILLILAYSWNDKVNYKKSD